MAILGGRRFEVSVPVLIVGAGACGLTAALAARGRGAEVLVLERDPEPRGNTSLSGGQIPAAGTRLQKEAGVDDSPERFAADLLAKARHQTDAEMARHVARESGPTVDWLVHEHRLPLSLVTSFLYPGHSTYRMHGSPNRFGAELMRGFLAAGARLGVEVVTGAHVTDLHAEERGRVSGVRVTRPDGSAEDIGCEALILASNGFGGNPDMVRAYIPEIAEAIYFGHEGNTGEALRWGLELGAAVADLGSYQGHGAVTTPHHIHLAWPAITEGGVQVTLDGRRFSNENAGYSEQAVEVLRQPGGVAWTIFDERCHRVALQQHSHRSALAAGAIRRAESVTELARVTALPLEALRATLDAVEAMARGAHADPFGRDLTRKPPLAPPYYAARVTGALFHTQGGLVVDRSARVLRRDGTPFPNLFAAGGAARGLSGPSRWGYLSGSGLLMATTLGRVAGEAAAALVA